MIRLIRCGAHGAPYDSSDACRAG